MNPLRSLFLGLSRIPLPALLLIIGFIAAGVTALVVGYIHEQEDRLKQAQILIDKEREGQIYTVVRAVKDIPEGATIGSDSLEERQEHGKAPGNSLENASLAIGRISKYRIPAGTIVSFHDFTEEISGFESRLKPGYRAVTFPIDSSSGVAGFVGPGSRVDILASAGSGNDTKTGCILSDAEVIAVGETIQRGGNSTTYQGNTVTVAISPDDTTKLIKAQVASGKLYLALRNQKDHTPVAVIDVTNLYDKPVASIDVPAPPMTLVSPPEFHPEPQPVSVQHDGHSVEVISGAKKDTITVPSI